MEREQAKERKSGRYRPILKERVVVERVEIEKWEFAFEADLSADEELAKLRKRRSVYEVVRDFLWNLLLAALGRNMF